jgi:hypothetical protein
MTSKRARMRPLTTIQPTDQVFIRRPGDWTTYYAASWVFNRDVLQDLRMEPVVAISDQVGDDIEVAIQLGYQSGDVTLQEQKAFTVYLASDEDGEVLAATAPDGGWAKGSSGALINFVANKVALAVTDDEGLVEFTITESGTSTFYLVMLMPDGILYGPLAIAFDTGSSV